ncbi:hypothetical protein [Actinomadura rugatobispora]|uniref:DUF4386 family protein n=1 Tax=Actinomadura rugatobispora TaxID=1994 RepID=A0ABW1A855_9ACTN|nr:hypothetical protein GCM10010200_041700 [Actinomadura rugatobispora]
MDTALPGRRVGPLETPTRFAFHAAPACMLVYGVVRVFDGRDGQYGPGLAWTVGHVFFLAALLLLGVVIAGLYRTVPTGGRAGRAAAAVAAVVGLAGLLTFVRVAVVDIVVGLRAADATEKRALARLYADAPDVLPKLLYDIGPLFFELGLFALLLHLALGRPQRVSWWSLALIAFGFLAITVELDLLPVAAALIWLGMASIDGTARRRGPSGTSAGTPTARSSSPG